MQNWLHFIKDYPHEFTIQYPPRRAYFMQHFRASKQEGLFNQEKELLLYLHIPFCESKCYYCNFAVDVRNKESVFEAYTEALCKEIVSYEDVLHPEVQIKGIDIGGGTPTRLPIPLLQKVLQQLTPFIENAKKQHLFPLSIETTPNIAANELDKLQMLLDYGVERVSMGIQSFNVTNLADVNRSLHIRKNEEAVANIRKVGFKRFNADLIFGLPQQSIIDWQYDIERIIELAPDSITTYDCLYRGKGRALTRKTKSLPSIEKYGAMYDLAYQLLTEAGYYAPYGSVNYSKYPDETGTSAYFEGRLLDGAAYLGLGNYSSNQIDDYWYFNTYKVDAYIEQVMKGESVIGDFYRLPAAELYAKYLLYSFNYGFLDEMRFQKRFGHSLGEVFADSLQVALDNGWMVQDGTRWRLVEGQFKNMNYLRSLFYSKQAKQWLMGLGKSLVN